MVKEKLYAVVFHIYNVDLKAINTSLIVPQMKYKKMKKSIGERIWKDAREEVRKPRIWVASCTKADH